LSANLPPGDGSYVQNRNSQQSGNANFNINGNGTVGGTLMADIVRASDFINAGTQYNINGNQVLSKDSVGDTTISSGSGFVSVPQTLRVGGLLAANGGLHVNGDLEVNGDSIFRARTKILPVIGGTSDLCYDSDNYLAVCSSSLRYKKNLAPYGNGLDIVNRLRPITFTWIQGGMRDVGFGAEDVEKVDPLLVTYNKQGQVEGVKYDRISVVLVNAVREQQGQIEKQQQQITRQQTQLEQQRLQIEDLKKLICLEHADTNVCREK
jgi:hypothetical protein